MNKDSFLKLLENPRQVTSSDMAELEEAVKLYPYCQLAHMLTAKAHQQLESPQVNQNVKRAAVYAVNRNVLKKYLFGQSFPLTDKADTPARQTPEIPHTGQPEDLENMSDPEASVQETPFVPFSEQQPAEQPSMDATPQTADINTDQKQDHMLEEGLSINIRQVNKKEQNEIIETFIKNEPRISSLQKADRNMPQTSQDLSQKSIILPSGVISENLAGIMIKQGKTDKAIEIYEKLILKYPQKKAYFAEKIEHLRNK